MIRSSESEDSTVRIIDVTETNDVAKVGSGDAVTSGLECESSTFSKRRHTIADDDNNALWHAALPKLRARDRTCEDSALVLHSATEDRPLETSS